MIRFAAIGLDHRHIYHQVAGLIEAGATCVGYCPETSDPRVLAGFRERFPDLPAVERQRLVDDPDIDVICCAAIPRDRAAIAIECMRAGKDVMVDKPGVTTLDDLAAIERSVAETGRIFSVCFSERFVVPAAELAGKLVADGAIGRVIQTVGLGPHRLNRAIRPGWFFDPDAFGGILVDIASHQIDQFLFYTGSTDARVEASTVANFGHADLPQFQDFGEVLLASDRARGYVRVDWFTPDGLPTWGDGRLIILGTRGTIELRKYVDIAGRPGTDHVFVADGSGTRHIDASREPLSYFGNFLSDVRQRSETAQTQRHVFLVSQLAIEAQNSARDRPTWFVTSGRSRTEGRQNAREWRLETRRAVLSSTASTSEQRCWRISRFAARRTPRSWLRWHLWLAFCPSPRSRRCSARRMRPGRKRGARSWLSSAASLFLLVSARLETAVGKDLEASKARSSQKRLWLFGTARGRSLLGQRRGTARHGGVGSTLGAGP